MSRHQGYSITTKNKFIILRGPSGAGKSTVAKRLFSEAKTETALLEQDEYRNLSTKDEASWREVMMADARTALRDGKNVILDGIFRPERYLPSFEQIWSERTGENYLFYFDVSFDETVRRHATRAKSQDFTAEEMKAWWDAAARMGVDREIVIPEASSVDEMVVAIQQAAGI